MAYGMDAQVGSIRTDSKVSKFGERIITSLGEANNEISGINTRLNKLEQSLLPPTPQNPCPTDKPNTPSALMDVIFYGIAEIRKQMNYTRDILNRLENEL